MTLAGRTIQLAARRTADPSNNAAAIVTTVGLPGLPNMSLLKSTRVVLWYRNPFVRIVWHADRAD